MFMQRTSFAAALALAVSLAPAIPNAQSTATRSARIAVNADQLMRDVEVLADDAMAGRLA